MSKFTYFWRFEAYVIKLLHLVDFSCWGPKVRFFGYLGANFGSKTLETRSPLHYNLKLKISALHFKLICGKFTRYLQCVKFCSFGDSEPNFTLKTICGEVLNHLQCRILFLRRFLGNQQNLNYWRNQKIEYFNLSLIFE